jgi:flagellar hook-associated protein 3 FlgL
MSIIRSTDGFLYDLVRGHATKVGKEIAKLEEQAFTGRRVNRPSDAPAEMVQINRIREELANQQVYTENSSWARSLQGLTDQVLGEVNNLLQRSSEIAVGMSNEHYNAQDRQAAAAEVQELRGHMVILSNTELGGRYLFSGDAVDTEPFDTAGNYQGLTEAPEALIGDDTWVQVGWDGSEVFQGSIDVFQVLDDLDAALSANDPDQVFALISDIQAASKQSIESRQEVGWQYARSEDGEILASNLSAEFTEHLDSMIGANEAAVYMKLQQARYSFQSAMQVAAAGMNLSLFNQL